MDMGQKIKDLRLAKGFTQEELGRKIGVKKAAIQKYENGTVENLKRSTIATLATVLDCTPTYLMGWEDEKGNIAQSGDFVVSNGQVIEFDKLNDENKRKMEDYFRLLILEQMSKEEEN